MWYTRNACPTDGKGSEIFLSSGKFFSNQPLWKTTPFTCRYCSQTFVFRYFIICYYGYSSFGECWLTYLLRFFTCPPLRYDSLEQTPWYRYNPDEYVQREVNRIKDQCLANRSRTNKVKKQYFQSQLSGQCFHILSCG